eukprot:3863479-Rhodomonas_salina.2
MMRGPCRAQRHKVRVQRRAGTRVAARLHMLGNDGSKLFRASIAGEVPGHAHVPRSRQRVRAVGRELVQVGRAVRGSRGGLVDSRDVHRLEVGQHAEDRDQQRRRNNEQAPH